MVIPALPEILEDDIHASVDARTDALQTLRELGPPDLVHLVKQASKSQKQSGAYHHVTGIDASSSASLAAYVNTLTYNPHDKVQKVVSALFCCYNAFSRLDMRVQVTIPGSVESYCVDERGERRPASEALWLETYLCAVLRAYSYADDGSGDMIKKIAGVRRFNPITGTEAEHKFLDAAERLFFKGWQLGSDPEVQVPNLVANHLTSGLLAYIHTTGRYASGINLFEKLRTRDVEVSSLLARVYLAADEEVRAISLLHEAIQQLPMDYSLLDVQAEFLKGKGRGDLALECAKRSVTAAPSEFGTWARLAEIYVYLEEWELALLTLNSCPMFTYQDKDAPRMPPPTRVFFPELAESMLDEISDDTIGDVELVHPTLRKFQAAGYKGTFLKAYSLLTEITAKIGWDRLLKIRSQVFVMEEEYRSERQAGGAAAANQDPTSRSASTTALRSKSATSVDGADGNKSDEPTATQPTDESSRTPDTISEKGDEYAESMETAKTAVNGEPVVAADEDAIEKPEHTVASEVVKSGSEDPETTHASTGSTSTFPQFHNKRLCERWLDNLFMVLYEDLRVYTLWRTEMARSTHNASPNSNSLPPSGAQYKKSAEEWEIIGELAERLHHPDEAVEAYQSCLAIRFSPKAMRGILHAHEKRGGGAGGGGGGNAGAKAALGPLIRLVAWQYRWYSEFSPSLLQSIRVLIEDEGAVKVRSIVQATSLPQSVLDLTHHYAGLCAAFRSSGSDG